MLRRRTAIYAALALAVPLPAFALSGDDSSGSASLGVAASLDECGIAASTVVCKIDASWNTVAGAERYTASVTSPDGAVTDYGEVGGTSTSLWVPYVGNGTYTVTVSAWGTPPGADKPDVIAKQRAVTGEAQGGRAKPDATGSFSNDAADGDATDPSSADGDPVPSEPGTDQPPACVAAAAPATPDPGADSSTATTDATGVAESGAAEECPDPADPGTTTTTTGTTTTPAPSPPAPDGG
jgi:hypothetical protein